MTYNQLSLEQLMQLKASSTYKKKTVLKAYAMWGLFGLIGGHRYYLGDTRTAIKMTATIGGLGIWTLIDAFKLPQRVKERNRELKGERQQINAAIRRKKERQQQKAQFKEKPLKSALRYPSMSKIDEMDGEKFEAFLKKLLEAQGYKVQLTATSGDYGADLVLVNQQRKRIIVQAKRYNAKVGIRAVQEIASAKNYYKADECWVVTNNYFTEPAINLAASNKVKLIDRKRLIQWLQ